MLTYTLGVKVFVHFGGERPINYKNERVSEGSIGVRVQCLGGILYNWVIEKKNLIRGRMKEILWKERLLITRAWE